MVVSFARVHAHVHTHAHTHTHTLTRSGRVVGSGGISFIRSGWKACEWKKDTMIFSSIHKKIYTCISHVKFAKTCTWDGGEGSINLMNSSNPPPSHTHTHTHIRLSALAGELDFTFRLRDAFKSAMRYNVQVSSNTHPK